MATSPLQCISAGVGKWNYSVGCGNVWCIAAILWMNYIKKKLKSNIMEPVMTHTHTHTKPCFFWRVFRWFVSMIILLLNIFFRYMVLSGRELPPAPNSEALWFRAAHFWGSAYANIKCEELGQRFGEVPKRLMANHSSSFHGWGKVVELGYYLVHPKIREEVCPLNLHSWIRFHPKKEHLLFQKAPMLRFPAVSFRGEYDSVTLIQPPFSRSLENQIPPGFSPDSMGIIFGTPSRFFFG